MKHPVVWVVEIYDKKTARWFPCYALASLTGYREAQIVRENFKRSFTNSKFRVAKYRRDDGR